MGARRVDGDVLPGGPTGPGLDNDAEVELFKFSYPATRFPGYDKDGTKAVYAFFQIKITQVEGPKAGKATFHDHWVESDALDFALKSIGAFTDKEDSGAYDFDDDELIGKKLVGVELKEPRDWNGRQFTGNIRGFIGD